MGNRFHASLRILSLEMCKQMLTVDMLKGWAMAEKARKLNTKINKS